MKKMTAREHLRQRLADIEGGRKHQARLDAEALNQCRALLARAVEMIDELALAAPGLFEPEGLARAEKDKRELIEEIHAFLEREQ